jgi:hypothetical protein
VIGLDARRVRLVHCLVLVGVLLLQLKVQIICCN